VTNRLEITTKPQLNLQVYNTNKQPLTPSANLNNQQVSKTKPNIQTIQSP